MISIPYNRTKALGWAAVGLALVGCGWYTQRYRPASQEIVARAAAIATREARVREARAASVELGPAGLDALLARFRSDSVRLTTRIASATEAGVVGVQVKDAIAEIVRRAGVRIARTEPLASGVIGGFQSSGLAVILVGRYDDIGFVVAEVESLQRLTRIDAVSLHAIPDTLVRGAHPYGGESGTGLATADSAGVASGLSEAGEEPFTAAARINVRWFTQMPAGASVGSAEAPAIGSTFPGAGAP